MKVINEWLKQQDLLKLLQLMTSADPNPSDNTCTTPNISRDNSRVMTQSDTMEGLGKTAITSSPPQQEPKQSVGTTKRALIQQGPIGNDQLNKTEGASSNASWKSCFLKK